MDVSQKNRLERARLQYENLLNNSIWADGDATTSLNKENYTGNDSILESYDKLYRHDQSKLEVANIQYNAADGGYKHREGYENSDSVPEHFSTSRLMPSSMSLNKSDGKYPSTKKFLVNNELESRFRTNTSTRNNDGNCTSISKLRDQSFDARLGVDERTTRTLIAESIPQKNQAFGTNGNIAKNEMEHILPIQGASDDPFWDDRSDLIIKLQASSLICRLLLSSSSCPCLNFAAETYLNHHDLH